MFFFLCTYCFVATIVFSCAPICFHLRDMPARVLFWGVRLWRGVLPSRHRCQDCCWGLVRALVKYDVRRGLGWFPSRKKKRSTRRLLQVTVASCLRASPEVCFFAWTTFLGTGQGTRFFVMPLACIIPTNLGGFQNASSMGFVDRQNGKQVTKFA